MKTIAKRIASLLPSGLRQTVQRGWYSYRIRTGDFKHYEPEFERMTSWVAAGDFVLDVGANIGIFAHRLSMLVGEQGRVIAFEPIPETFRFLVHNSRLFPFDNVTFINMAVSSTCTVASMQVPLTAAGIPASALASIRHTQGDSDGGQAIVCMPLDQMDFPHRISFVKIDVEGHEFEVLMGMQALVKKDRPRFVIEGNDEKIRCMLVDEFGYRIEQIPGSPNSIFHP